MKTNKLKILLLTLIFILSGLSNSFAETKLNQNSLRMKIQGTKFLFDGIVRAVIKKDNNIKKIIIAFEDPERKMMMHLAIEYKDLLSKEIHFNTDYNNLSIMFMSRNFNFNISPAIRFARNDNNSYIEKSVILSGERKKLTRYLKRGSIWKKMSRKKRISEGRGVIRNKNMEGTAFTLLLRPVISNGKIIELKGSFSGVAKSGINGFRRSKRVRDIGNFIIIKDGRFSVEVDNR